MAITIRSNVASLSAQRNLAERSDLVSASHERLSSGLRIGRACDDPAGLAVSSALQSNSRVYSQALRNISDGISLLNVAQGALLELSSITTRQQELCEQSANGVYGHAQRQALHREGEQLTMEYNRIIETTVFNGLRLLEPEQRSAIRIQAGRGVEESLEISFGAALTRSIGNGSFSERASFNVVNGPHDITAADLDSDGNVDLITPNYSSGTVSVLLGNGNGTFKASQSFYTSGNPRGVLPLDLNGDTIPDLVTARGAGFSLVTGNGDGTFRSPTIVNVGSTNAVLGWNAGGDAFADLIFSSGASGVVNVVQGIGDGSFKSAVSYEAGANTEGLFSADLDGDGASDLVVGHSSGSMVSVLLGNRDGSLRARADYEAGATPVEVIGADLNGDSLLDIGAINPNGTVSVLLGNGDGTFRNRNSFTIPSGSLALSYGDYNGDGTVDLVSSDNGGDNGTTLSVLSGNGDGTFRARRTLTTGESPRDIVSADFNNDGVVDLASSDWNSGNGSSVSVFLTGAKRSMSIPPTMLQSAKSARAELDALSQRLNDISTELGSIGAMQSRLEVAYKNIGVARENYIAASSRIMDVDVAAEAASSTTNTIRQQVAASVAVQANQMPSIALALLSA